MILLHLPSAFQWPEQHQEPENCMQEPGMAELLASQDQMFQKIIIQTVAGKIMAMTAMPVAMLQR